ncbi:sigma 54-interacting transcriptional regulator [Alicyclobacillus sp. ALC3]|uniref:sigma 54-interacting transcriptional regulator n=1 Tax=Alicyclobacillus sp. ALC3 TaxID=2796143 RepID=UPI002378F686|nr:sigma 54-interacting transcriptional regulator [Alicyclobacillus sp. ALC3]WDL97490.1 sigma 54-interacting transcriptional regulator [Alicyclobacillus sp. ALC3]
MDVSVFDRLDTPVLMFDRQGQLVFANAAAVSLLSVESPTCRWPDVYDELPDCYSYRIHSAMESEERPAIVLECLPPQDPVLAEENRRLKGQLEELERLMHETSDELFVSDHEGRVVWVTDRVETLYNLSPRDIIGKTVFELEANRLFYPSVTAIVLRERKRTTILQTAYDGRRIAVTGTPVFDDDGRLVRVISTGIDVRDLVGLMPTAVPTEQQGSKGRRRGPAAVEPWRRLEAGDGAQSFVATSVCMHTLLQKLERAAKTDATVLLLGETGVGKNRLAKAVHDWSERRSGPLIEVNCATIPETLFDSELFGYAKGAFTGANREGKRGKVDAANGGTLFLNEVGELPLGVQAKLLDFLQTHTYTPVGGVYPIAVDLRVVCATNRDLMQMVRQGTFRADLYYRLNVISLRIPPLRERLDDIAPLATHLVSLLSQRYSLGAMSLAPDALASLSAHTWPGNVRELENVLERACLYLEQDQGLLRAVDITPLIDPADSTDAETGFATPGLQQNGHSGGRSLGHSGATAPREVQLAAALEQVEREAYELAAQTCRSTYEVAAQLGVSQATAVRRLKKFGLQVR